MSDSIDHKMSAVIDGLYRYWLEREWDEQHKKMVFCMLNPSTADANVDDPTIRRCIGFAKREGYGGLIVVNMYAFRATDPRVMRHAADPHGPFNDEYLRLAARYSAENNSMFVCAWGGKGGQGFQTLVQARNAKAAMKCLGRTKFGSPKHPLYVRADQPFEEYE